MRTLTIPASLLLAAFCLAGCEEALPPATTASNVVPSPNPGEAMVTFLRPTSSCDAGEYVIVVDEHGRFVGNLAAGTQVSFPTHPGTHVFYAWSNVDLIVTRDPNFGAVAATRVKAHAGEDSYVFVASGRHSTGGCQARFVFELVAAGSLPNAAEGRADAIELVHETRPVTTDRVAGQIQIESRPAHLHYFLELGARNLERQEAARAAIHRQRALWREEDSIE